MRFPKLTLAPLVLVTLLGCSHAEEEKAKLDDLQKKADEKLAQAENEAKTKLADLQKELDDSKAALAKAEDQLKDALSKVQSGAEDQAKGAEAALVTARQAFKAKSKLEYSDANKDLQDVQGKVSKVAAKSKAAVTQLMQDIMKQQKVLAKDIAAFDAATLDSFHTINSQFEKDLAVYKAKIRAVKAKVQ
jgi:phosphoenolpyruvate-protein kinase (PTS system EI component)